MAIHRDLVLDAINHRQPARLPVDFGGTTCSGVHCSVVEALRAHFGLAKRLIVISEPGQMLGRIDEDLQDAMGVDITGTRMVANRFGVRMDGPLKEWRTPWGQTVMMPAGMAFSAAPEGGAYIHPQGDESAPPSALMPGSGYFFDSIVRQGEFDEDNPNPDDNMEEYQPYSDDFLAAAAREAKAARVGGRAVVTNIPGTALGDISGVPGPALKHPKGIRDIAEWYMSIALRPDFVRTIFDRQSALAVENLKRLHQAVGDNYDVVALCGTDFGTQIGTFCSRETFDDLYLPYYQRMTGWIHENTPWKIYKHSCGAVEGFIDGFINAGFDILNPVQCSATGMEPEHLKKTYGSRVTFWGAGVNTQKTLPFGTPAEVRAEVLERCRVFAPGGGFIFNAIHNVQALTPVENVVAMLDAVKEFNQAGR